MSARLLAQRTAVNATRIHRMVAIRAMSTQGYHQMDNAYPSTSLKVLAGVLGAGAVVAYTQADGVKRHPVVSPDEELPVAKSQIIKGATQKGEHKADFNPTFRDMEIIEEPGKITMIWDQHGEKYAQVVDLTTGEVVEGPGPARGADGGDDNVTVVTTPAETESHPTPTSTPSATEPAPAATPTPEATPAQAANADQQAELKDLLERLAKIEKSLASDKAALAGPAAGMNGFPQFVESNHSLLKKHLRPEVYLSCETRVTPNGFTFRDVIQSGCDNQDSGVGAYAGDEESYTVFAPLFDRIIEDYHNGYKPTDRHVSDMDASKLQGVPDADGDYVISTRIRVGRNIRGLGLSPGISRAQRRKVEQLVTDALNKLEGDLAGKYYSLSSMSEEDRKQLVADHFLFKKGDRFLQSAGANRDWPESRGIFHNNDKTFLVWVNEEDQMRIISMEMGADAKKIFERLSRGIAAIEEKIKSAGYEFAHNDHLGFIHSCPTNCGTGMRASVHAKLPNVGAHPDFKKWCAKLRLQPRGIHGEHSESAGGVYDLSNKERLGKSEVELVQTMIDGVQVLIEAEKALAAGQEVPAVLRD
eukprot:TRINITY_DN11879_c0_g3_i2.p1 TRINITY_DN11879_c0_g3~~TRINITY_DN11879_c0_g3_i2.p1  ORF type:complete len:587 (+),score=163.54 TRINITY_DN11879_c0_g3_i2:439-2199(+)